MTEEDRGVMDKPVHPLWGRVALLAFGVLAIALLAAIEHQNWFHIRPASGTAQAMYYAGKPLDGRTATNGPVAR